jgi:hypothetical protein
MWRSDQSRAELEATLWNEGVVKLGEASAELCSSLELFCRQVPFDTSLVLGCERTEDSYNDKTAAVFALPWIEWVNSHNLQYAYASVLTALPTDMEHQGWHRDTPGNEESSDHQLTLMVYLTDIYRENGATEFKKINAPQDEPFTVDGPRGTVVAFWSSRTLHRGLGNRTQFPRILMYISFDVIDDMEMVPFI